MSDKCSEVKSAIFPIQVESGMKIQYSNKVQVPQICTQVQY